MDGCANVSASLEKLTFSEHLGGFWRDLEDDQRQYELSIDRLIRHLGRNEQSTASILASRNRRLSYESIAEVRQRPVWPSDQRSHRGVLEKDIT